MDGGIYEIYQKALRMQSEGKSIIHMEIGKPDFDSPEGAKKAAIESLNSGFVHYTGGTGTPEIRKAICDKERRENGIVADPDTEIMVTAGACEALLSVFMTILDPGDEIMIPSPYFPAYSDMVYLAGGVLNDVTLTMEKGFALTREDLEKAYNSKVKAVLVNTPSNPSGVIIDEKELKKIADFAIEKDLIVISDETYDQFLFEGKHKSISTFPGMKERTIIINSSSKIFSMTGWRVGYAIMPKEMVPYANKIHQNMSTCATSFVQQGAAYAYEHEMDFTRGMIKEFKERRDIIIKALSEIDGIKFVEPKGAFYILPDISKFGISSAEFCARLLEEKGVAASPGESFGKAGEGCFRMSYACSKEEIVEAMKRLKEFVSSIK